MTALAFLFGLFIGGVMGASMLAILFLRDMDRTVKYSLTVAHEAQP
jgi:hypothetical protein